MFGVAVDINTRQEHDLAHAIAASVKERDVHGGADAKELEHIIGRQLIQVLSYKHESDPSNPEFHEHGTVADLHRVLFTDAFVTKRTVVHFYDEQHLDEHSKHHDEEHEEHHNDHDHADTHHGHNHGSDDDHEEHDDDHDHEDADVTQWGDSKFAKFQVWYVYYTWCHQTFGGWPVDFWPSSGKWGEFCFTHYGKFNKKKMLDFASRGRKCFDLLGEEPHEWDSSEFSNACHETYTGDIWADSKDLIMYGRSSTYQHSHSHHHNNHNNHDDDDFDEDNDDDDSHHSHNHNHHHHRYDDSRRLRGGRHGKKGKSHELRV
jgi:hypothetical protein